MRLGPITLIAALLLLATPAHAARTATISGTPSAHASPEASAEITGHPPTGATVTIEHCTGETAGFIAPAPGEDTWCLIRGLGWIAAAGLSNLSADPQTLLPDNAGFDPLKEAAPAWDDLQSPFD